MARSVPLSRFTPRVGGGSAFFVRHHVASEVMRTYILAGFFSLCGLLSIAADTPSSDTVIQQRIVGTWLLNWIAFQCTTTISTNGDYVTYQSNPRSRYEGTIKIKDGLWIDTLKKCSVTNQPVPHVFTNVIIRLTDHELIFRAQNGRQPMMWERVKQ